MDVRLLIIDAQEDFCNPDWGTLFVPGADQDMIRLAAMISRLGKKINYIAASLDMHQEKAIFHPMFWIDSSGHHPDPFTIITVKDVEDVVWNTTSLAEKDWAANYVKALQDGDPNSGKKGGRYPLCIWPYHCLIGTPGSNMVPVVRNVLGEWCKKYNQFVAYIAKGSNYRTEHYSIVRAEVTDPNDPTTDFNFPLLQSLQDADIIAIAGQAKSHCVANTVLDLMESLGDEKYIKKIHLITDAMSNVPGFESLGDAFIDEFRSRGGQETTTATFLA